MGIIDVPVLPWQAEEFCNIEYIRLIVGGFASGKSWWAANWFLNRCLQFPEAFHYVGAKDLPQVKRGPMVTIRGELAARGIDHNYNQSTGEIQLPNGCRIGTLSAQNYLSFRSLECDTIWADELADWGPSAETAFVRYLAPRLRYSPKGKQYAKFMTPMMRMTTNPCGLGTWLYRLVVEMQFCGYRNVSLRNNYLMPNLEGYIAQREASMSKDLWPFLIDGNWGSVTTGAVYKNFARAITCTKPKPPLTALAIDMQKPLLWTHDFNVGLMSSAICQIHQQRVILDKKQNQYLPVKMMESAARVEVEGYQRALVYVLDEILLKNSGTPDVGLEFLRRYEGIARQTGVILYGDASGGGKSQQLSSQAAARSDWAILIQMLRIRGIKVEFRVPTANPSVMDRINEVKAQIQTGAGLGLFIDEVKCRALLNDLEGVVWKEGTNDIDKDDLQMTHISDALGYLIWVERTLSKNGTVVFRSPEAQ